jgi:hypothetical protein
MLKHIGQKMRDGAYQKSKEVKLKKRHMLKESSGSIHDLLQKNNSKPNSINPVSDNEQKFIQESARAALQNERMKLN